MKRYYPYRRPVLLSFLLTCLLAGMSFSHVQAQTRLWGTVTHGGASGLGVIYSIQPDGSGMQVRYNFQNDGIDGNTPSGGLTQAGSLLYGMTSSGGNSGNGTIYSIDPANGHYQKIHDFDGTGGSSPASGLTLYNGLLYGLTITGGANGTGVLFSYDPAAGVYTDVFDLNTTTGDYPTGNFTVISNQLFFTTSGDGGHGAGTLAVYYPAAGTCTDLYDFYYYVSGDLVFYNNLLYDFYSNGGSYSNGELFSFDVLARNFKVLYQFPDPSKGINPYQMILDGSKFYGSTAAGGSGTNGSSGVLFSFDPAGAGTYTDLFDFDNNNVAANGVSPFSKLLLLNGHLIGTATYGGTGAVNQSTGNGVLYDFDITTSIYKTLLDFDGSTNGMNPSNSPLLAVGPVTPGATAQTITFTDITKNYGDGDFYLPATSSSGLPITYNSSDHTVGSLIGTGIHITGAGTCTITASQPGDGTYAAAAAVPITLTVKKAPLLISADDQIAYQDQPVPPLTIHYSGFVKGEDSSFLTALPVANSVVDATTPQGSYPITVSGAASNNYDITYRSGTFYVYGLQQSFTVTDTTSTYGDPDLAVATASSGLPVTYTVRDGSVAEPSTTAGLLHIKGAGVTTVIVMQAGNTTYAPGSDSVTVTINRAPLTITANSQSMTYGQQAPAFTIGYSGFVNGEDASALITPPVAVSSAPSVPAYPGTYLLEVSGAVSNNYAFTYVNGVFTVTLAGDSLNAYSSAPGTLAVNILSTAARQTQLALYSLTGQKMLTAELSLQNGFNAFTFPAGNLAAGIYIVRVEGPGMHLNQKLRIK